MERFMMVNSRLIRSMVRVNFNSPMDLFILEDGIMVNSMVEEPIMLLMVLKKKENGNMERELDGCELF